MLVLMEVEIQLILVGLHAGNLAAIHTPGMNKVWSQPDKVVPLGLAVVLNQFVHCAGLQTGSGIVLFAGCLAESQSNWLVVTVGCRLVKLVA